MTILTSLPQYFRLTTLPRVFGRCQYLSYSVNQKWLVKQHNSSFIRRASTVPAGFCCERLTGRQLLKISGPESPSFIQGLITNDVNLLYESQNSLSAIYAMMLNVKGRVMYDLIIYRQLNKPEDLLVECNEDITENLLKILKRYKLRKKLELSDVSDKVSVWAVFSGLKSDPRLPVTSSECKLKGENSAVIGLVSDPRVETFGHRLLLPASVIDASLLVDGSRLCTGEYARRRYEIGLSEGTTDLPPGECLPLESNLVFLNGVSFDKGCYIGQELTARTQYTGVIRKRLMPLIASSNKVVAVKSLTVENSSGKPCGKIRHFCGKHGLGLLRVEEVVGKGPLVIKNSSSSEIICEAETFIPPWWKTKTDEIMKKTIAKQPVVIDDE